MVKVQFFLVMMLSLFRLKNFVPTLLRLMISTLTQRESISEAVQMMGLLLLIAFSLMMRR